MTRRFTVIEDDLEARASEYLHHVDNRILSCRAERHNEPKLPRRSGPLPRGMKFTRSRMTGVTMLEVTCADCGRVRKTITGPGGELTLPARNRYKYTPEWKAGKGVRITRQQALDEKIRRMREDGQIQIEMVD